MGRSSFTAGATSWNREKEGLGGAEPGRRGITEPAVGDIASSEMVRGAGRRNWGELPGRERGGGGFGRNRVSMPRSSAGLMCAACAACRRAEDAVGLLTARLVWDGALCAVPGREIVRSARGLAPCRTRSVSASVDGV